MYTEFDRADLFIDTLPSYHPRVSSLSKDGTLCRSSHSHSLCQLG